MIFSSKKWVRHCLHAGWMGAGLFLSGCSSTLGFVSPPPPSFHTSLSAEINGDWVFELNDTGVHILVEKDGAVRLNFIKTKPSSDPVPGTPFTAQTLRFDNTNWLLVDMRNIATIFGEKSHHKAPYQLLRFVQENPDRLCGISMSVRTRDFAEAIKAGQLEGEVETDATTSRIRAATVTSEGTRWVAWWIGLPESQKTFAPMEYCFRRMKR